MSQVGAPRHLATEALAFAPIPDLHKMPISNREQLASIGAELRPIDRAVMFQQWSRELPCRHLPPPSGAVLARSNHELPVTAEGGMIHHFVVGEFAHRAAVPRIAQLG